MSLFGKQSPRRGPAGPGLVGLYGKHPSAGDFLRLNANGPEVLQLDQWLSVAIDRARRALPDWDRAYNTFFSASFLFSFPQDERCTHSLCGVMVPSQDKSGRQFPLIVFATVDPETCRQGYHAISNEPFVLGARRLLQRRNTLSRDDLLAEVQRLAPPGEESFKAAQEASVRYLKETSWLQAFNLMLGPGAMTQTWSSIHTLRATMQSVRDVRVPPRFAVRCPLGKVRATEGNVAWWLELARRNLPVSLLPNVIWTPGQLLVHPGPVRSKALFALLDPESRDEEILDIVQSPQQPPAGAATALPGPDRPLGDLLE